MENNSGRPDKFVAEYNLSRPVGSFIELSIALVKDPRRFFAAMPLDAGYTAPALFVLISFLVPIVLMTVRGAGPIGLLLFLAMVVSWPIFVGLIHLVAVKVVKGQGSFQATFRASAYPNFVFLFVVIPFLGTLAQIFGLYLTAHGLAAVHKISLGKAILALAVVVGGQLLLMVLIMSQYRPMAPTP